MTYNALIQFFPFIAWAALAYLVVRWLFRYWETQIATKKTFRLVFPVSPLVFLSRKIVISSLIEDEQIQTAIKQRAETGDVTAAEVDKTVRGYAKEIVPSFKAVFYFSIGYWLARGLLLTLYRAKLVKSEENKYAKIGRDSTVVLFMNHRSNIDVLLINYLLSRHSAVSHAAGEWARLWPLQHLVKLAGAYVVDRNADDPLYRLVLKRYVQMAVANGIHLGIFPEGGLTRDGTVQPLNYGLLNYVVTATWPGLDRDVVFIPVSFNYDRIPEQDKLVFSADTQFRERGKLYLAYSTFLFCARFLSYPFTQRKNRFGWSCASFGEPISLKAWQRSRGVELTSLSDTEKRKQINTLGEQLMGAVQDMIPVLPVHLLSTVLLENPQKKITPAALFTRSSELYQTLQAIQVPVFSYDTELDKANEQALYLLTHLGLVKRQEDQSLTIVESKIAMLQYYANSIAHYFKPDYTKTALQEYAIEFDQAKDRNKKFLSLMMDSYDRVRDKQIEGKGFFERFYDIFIDSSPLITAKFVNTDMLGLQAHLRHSLEHVQDYFISNKPSKRLREVARGHSKVGHDIKVNLYQYWQDSLIQAVSEYDADFNGSIKMSWQAVIAPGIAYMTSEYDVAEHQTNVIDNQQRILRVDDVSLLDVSHWVDHWSDRAPNKLALIGDDRQLTYGQLADEAQRLAGALRNDFSVESGDTVAFLGLNRPEFIVLSFACARIGAIVVPINNRLAIAEQTTFIERAEAKVIFVDDACQAILSSGDFAAKNKIILLDELTLDDSRDKASDLSASLGDYYLDVIERNEPLTERIGDIDSPMFILFTSGSTGEPKGAVLTQRAIHWNALNSRLMHDMRQSDLIATSLPFFHAGGINIQTLPAMQVGATVRVFSNFDVGVFMDYVQNDKPTLTVLVPTQMQALMKLPDWDFVDMTSIRAVTTGSTIVSVDLIRAWASKGIPVIQIYGCTESGPIAVHQTVAGVRTGLGTVGHPAMFTQLRIVDDQGQAVEHAQEGEILLRGPNIMSYYWKDEEATKQTFVDGWLLTGDMGYQDDDGRLHIVGRKKRLIISGGENIHPGEVEQVLELLPEIEQAAVMAITDAKWGEVPIAVVTASNEQSLDDALIREHLNQHLGRYKHPRDIIIVDSLPLTALEKIAYPELMVLINEKLKVE